MEISVLAQYLGLTEEELTELIEKENEKRLYEYSLIIKRTENKLRLCTRPEFAEDIYELLGKKSEEELTQAMLETLSIVAYKQPVTRQEIEEIRGVNSSYIMNSLLERGFIKEAGRKQVLGRPILYATDEAFLRAFRYFRALRASRASEVRERKNRRITYYKRKKYTAYTLYGGRLFVLGYFNCSDTVFEY